MSKKSKRRNKDTIARTDAEMTKSARAAKRLVYVLACVGLFAIPFQFADVPGFYNLGYYLTVMLAAGLAGCLLWAVHKKAVTFVYTPFFIALGLWLAVKLLTTATSTAPYQSIWGTYRVWSDGFLFALAVSVIAAVIITLRLDNRRVFRIIGLLSAEAVLIAAVTIGQALAAGFLHQKVRPDSPLGNADFFISYALLFIPILLALCVTYLRKRDWWRMTVYGIGSLIMLMALFVTLPTHLQTILLPGFENGKVDSTAGARDTKPISAGNFTQDRANNERWNEWRFGLQFGMERPLVGTGPSTTKQTFEAAIAQHRIDSKDWYDTGSMQRSHNDLIEQFSQEGVLGLVAYLVLWVFLIVIILRRYRDSEFESRPYITGLGIGLVLWFCFNQVLFTTLVSGVFVMVWVALLLTMVKSARPASGRAPLVLLIIVSIILSAGGIWAIKYYINDTRVDLSITESNQLMSQAPSDQSREAWLHVESLASAAFSDMPFESYYSQTAAVSSLFVFTQVPFNNSAEHEKQADKALGYARQMLADEPNNAENIEFVGDMLYLVSPIGSKEAQAGQAQANRAIALGPNWLDLYMNVASTAVSRKDYATARKYVDMGLAAPLQPSDREKLQKFAASLPSQ